MRQLFALAMLLVCFSPTAPGFAGEICTTSTVVASPAWVFNETDLSVTLMKPGEGNNEEDCLMEPWNCATYRCDTTEDSSYSCKEPLLGHCAEVLLEQCIDPEEPLKFMTIIRKIELRGFGPCEILTLPL